MPSDSICFNEVTYKESWTELAVEWEEIVKLHEHLDVSGAKEEMEAFYQYVYLCVLVSS